MIRPAETELQRRRFTREDYHRMGDAGILAPEARVELLDGEVIDMSPIGPRHGSVVDRLNAFFTPRLADRAICRVQGALALSELSEPEPDFMVLESRDDFYASGHPGPEDVLLLVEVAETSLAKDLGEKLRLYAAAGIREYWIVSVERQTLIVHRKPTGGEYGFVGQLGPGERVAPHEFPELSFEIGALLGW